MYIPNVTCPSNCTPPSIDVSFDAECAGAGLRSGRFTWMIVVPLDRQLPSADWDDPSEWTAIKDDIAIVRGLGSLPEADTDTISLYNDPNFAINKTRVVPFDVTELTDNNYEVLQGWECGLKARVFVGTDDFLFDMGEVSVSVNLSSDGEASSLVTSHLSFTQEGRNIAMPTIFTNVFKIGIPSGT